MGVIDEKYQALGGATGWLGAPTIPESGTPDGKGRFRHYQNGSIYWNPATGAHEVHGSIRRRWQELGWETGFLGYPLTDEMTTPDGAGRYSHFQGGSIYWSPATGAYEVRNAGALRSHRIGLWGFADLHAHPASHLAFGGDAADVAFGGRPEGLMGIFWGKPGMRLEDSNATIADDLRSCVPDKHHDSPRRDGYDEDGVRHGTRTTVIAMANQLTNLPHQASGWPDFTGWPHALSVMHQQMHISWIHRAWQGGLRLLIASVTDSQTLSMFWTRSHGAPRPQPNPNYDYESAKFQLAFIRQFVAANSSWMQVVLTPAEARSAIAANKLAIILSVEMDTLTTEQIADLYRNHSVRHVTPIHLLNNKFGGVAVYSDMFNTANGYVNGDFFRVEHDSTLEFGLGRPERLIYISGDPFGGGDLFKYGAVEPHKIDEATYRNLGYPAPGHKNVRGLQKAEMQKLLRLGIMIDLAHMSEKSTEETLQLAEQYGMPVMNSHTGCRHEEHGHSERDLKFSHAARIGKLGGMIGLGTGGDSSSDPVAHWYALYREVLTTMQGRGVALGTDMNGFAPQVTSTEQAISYPVDVAVRFAGRGSQRGQPLGRLQVGNKIYDFTLDGLAHFGLLPDFLQAVSKHTSLEPMFRTAEETIQMWERVELATRKVNNATPSRLVALRAASGHYLYSEGGGQRRLLALANEITTSEIFEMIELGNNKVAFRAYNGKLIHAGGGGGGAVLVAPDNIAAWETFERIDQGNGVIALKAANSQYLSAEGGGGQEVVANRSQIRSWEKFVIVEQGVVSAKYGSVIKLKHRLTGYALHSHNARYGHPGSSKQQQVTAFAGADDNDLWRIVGPHGQPVNLRQGQAVQHGEIVRLQHILTGRNLHSHRGFPSPASGQQEVTCFGENGIGDDNDNWQIQVEGGGAWAAGKRIRLVHVLTQCALHSHQGFSHPQWTLGQQEVTGFASRDDNDWWYLAEMREGKPYETVQSLRVEIRMGGDGTSTDWPWRSDPSDAVGFVKLRDGRTIEKNFSNDASWAPHSVHVGQVDLPSGTRLGEITAFGIRSIHAGPNEAADNWMIDEVKVTFIGTTISGQLLSKAGSPLWHFQKNANQVWEAPIEIG